MLIISRKSGESFSVGPDIVVTILEIRSGQCRIGIAAPKAIKVLRSELQARDEAAKEAPCS